LSRLYRVTFENVLVSQPQDLVQITGASGRMLLIVRRWVGATDGSLPGSQMLSLRERRLPAIVTSGNGTAAPPGLVDGGDSNAAFTALVNSTTKATSTALPTILNEVGTHIYNGYEEPWIEPPTIGTGQCYVWELLSVVNGIVHLSGGVEVREIGG
jgi:hypothetical protein